MPAVSFDQAGRQGERGTVEEASATALWPSLRRLAAQLVGVSGRGAPVSLLECLDQLDRRAALVFEDGLHAGVRGGLQLLEGRWVIILNQGDGRQRARFTLAHEIGHIALGGGGGGTGRRRPLGWRIEEALCDVFAAELLMPAPWLRREWRGLRGEEAERVAARRRRGEQP